jgi:putative DNA primase/helicase
LTGIRRAEVEKIKAFLTRTHDKCRPAWGRFVVNQPRTSAFAGTTNDQEYLLDTTGNRRWWPVTCGVIDVEALELDRDQLFAEAVSVEAEEALFISFDLGHEIHALQESRRAKHPWEEILGGMTEKELGAKQVENEWRVFSSHLLTEVLGIEPKAQTNANSKDLARAMRALGWVKKDTPIRIGKRVANGYVKKVLLLERPKEKGV